MHAGRWRCDVRCVVTPVGSCCSWTELYSLSVSPVETHDDDDASIEIGFCRCLTFASVCVLLLLCTRSQLTASVAASSVPLRHHDVIGHVTAVRGHPDNTFVTFVRKCQFSCIRGRWTICILPKNRPCPGGHVKPSAADDKTMDKHG